jgi:omega-6 fatty acid desaturase (delta-12 desaturase)
MNKENEAALTGKALHFATTRFASESVVKSWWHVGSTFVLLLGSLAAAGLITIWPLRIFFSCLASLLMVRAFITFHDYMHGSILRGSRCAWILFRVYSALSLTPPRSWKKSHNYHHGHVGQVSTYSAGAFPIMTARKWHEVSRSTRLRYRAVRHPLTVLAGYLTVFFFGISLLPFLKNPASHWDSFVALLGHAALIAALWTLGGLDVAFFVILLPMTIASAIGSYLFFAQHSFKRAQILPPEDWSFHRAAMESSSYMRLGRVMRWFTGNIGFHHVHHLNVRIPFYRLPEAMEAIPELQSPTATTSLALRDIVESFRSCLWDEARHRMVSYREARRSVLYN